MHFFEGERGPSPSAEAKASDHCGGHRTADPPLFGLAQSDAVWAHYPDNQAGRRNAVISMKRGMLPIFPINYHSSDIKSPPDKPGGLFSYCRCSEKIPHCGSVFAHHSPDCPIDKIDPATGFADIVDFVQNLLNRMLFFMLFGHIPLQEVHG